MKKNIYFLRVFVLAFVLIIVSLCVISFKGNTCTYKVKIDNDNIKSVDDLLITTEKKNKIIKITSTKLVDNELIIKMKSVSKGRDFIIVENKKNPDENYGIEVFYVHKFKYITSNIFFGHCNYGKVIPLSIIIFISYLMYIYIKKIKKANKENLYQYKNISYYGIVIFLAVLILRQINCLLIQYKLVDTINGIMNIGFGLVTLFIFIILVVSNIILIKKEGFNTKNILGITLAFLLLFAMIFPTLLSDYLQSSTMVDVHNLNALPYYIELFVERSISIFAFYLECVLLGTIIVSIKAARHIPKYDKDYIIILGCKIKKDGSLTNLLKSRVDRAIQFSQLQKENTGKDIIFIPSGGKGSDEVISEAEAMKNYLVSQNIDEDKIVIEDQSTSTYENILNSVKIINNKNANIAFSTTNYHVFRAGNLATKFINTIEGIGSKTKSYFGINAFIREYIATLYSERKKHVVIFAVILFVILVLIRLTYLNNNI